MLWHPRSAQRGLMAHDLLAVKTELSKRAQRMEEACQRSFNLLHVDTRKSEWLKLAKALVTVSTSTHWCFCDTAFRVAAMIKTWSCPACMLFLGWSFEIYWVFCSEEEKLFNEHGLTLDNFQRLNFSQFVIKLLAEGFSVKYGLDWYVFKDQMLHLPSISIGCQLFKAAQQRIVRVLKGLGQADIFESYGGYGSHLID